MLRDKENKWKHVKMLKKKYNTERYNAVQYSTADKWNKMLKNSAIWWRL